MSFDIPLHIPDNTPEAQAIEAIASRDHVSPEEVVRRAIRALVVPRPARAPTQRRKAQRVPPITDEELAQIDRICPALKLLDDVTDEEWNNVLRGARRMNREDFTSRV